MLLDGRLKLRHLVLAVTIAEQGSVVKAAEHLHITQPVVTRGLRDLERILGVELFDRGPRGVTPTVFGEAFLDHARAIIGHVRHIGQHVQELSDATIGTVTVGTHLAGSNILLPRAIAALKATRPRVTVIVRDATPDLLVAGLLAGDIDLAVGRLTSRHPPERLQQVRLYEEPIRMVSRLDHPAHRRGVSRLEDLYAYPWIFPGEQTALRRELEELFERHRLDLPDDRIECTSPLTLRTLLVETDAIAALPFLIVDTDPQIGILPVPLERVTRTVGVTLPADRRPSPAVAMLLRHLYAVAADLRRSLIASDDASLRADRVQAPV